MMNIVFVKPSPEYELTTEGRAALAALDSDGVSIVDAIPAKEVLDGVTHIIIGDAHGKAISMLHPFKGMGHLSVLLCNSNIFGTGEAVAKQISEDLGIRSFQTSKESFPVALTAFKIPAVS